MLIDTHAHVNFSFFKKDVNEVIQRTLNEKIWMINVGAEHKTSKRAVALANKYEKGVYAAVGLHPIHLFETRASGADYDFSTRAEVFNYDIYEKLAKFEKVAAIGEIGLDYYHIDKNSDVDLIKKTQKKTFYEQLLLARKLGLPTIIHCRQAHDDMLVCLKDFRKKHINLIPKNKPWAVMHCFSGDEDLAWKYFNMGLIISFTGLITFSAQWDSLIRKMPLEKIMIETDCPFMTPEPHRGKRNEPMFVKYVARRIAEIKNLSINKVADITTKNARGFFNI
ncbi:MAG: TatD family hydrolase [Patescibacteria group bacterium]|nr:TatD family hydrolase [Patescibacteria group bacterium]